MDFQSLNIPFSSAVAKNLLNIALVIVIAVILDNLLRSFIRVPKNFDNKRALTFVAVFRNVISVIVYLFALYVIFVILGVNILPLLASASIIGIVIGLGMRSMIEDLISGLFLLSQNSIAINDYVKVDDSEGYIESIGFRTLAIRDESGALHIIPNGQIKKVINYSRNKANISVDISIKPDQDIDLVCKLMIDAIEKLKKDKEVGVSIYPKSQVDGIEDFKKEIMLVRATISTSAARRFEVGNKYRYLVKKEFEKHKITLA